MFSIIKTYIIRCVMVLFSIVPVKKNKIVFSSYRGRMISDSPKIIYEKMQNDPSLDIVWIIDPKYQYGNMRCVKEGSCRALYELATARIWVDNCRKKPWIRKRKNQYYIQTWHGNIAGKKVEADANLSSNYIRMAKHDSSMINFFVSGSEWSTNNYKDSFWYGGEFWETGLPRSDIFYHSNEDINSKVRAFYNINSDCKLILYAPTFRNSKTLDCYALDYVRLLNTVIKKYNGTWKVLVRLHPNLSELQSIIPYNQNVLNGLAYHEINDLIVTSDMLITDYSSCMFDAMEAGKKVLIFATDIDEYEIERGHYFSFDELPFPFAENNDQLSENIINFNDIKYKEEVETFMKKCGFFNNSHSAELIVKRIMKLMK